jgi:hypothetical protein
MTENDQSEHRPITIEERRERVRQAIEKFWEKQRTQKGKKVWRKHHKK